MAGTDGDETMVERMGESRIRFWVLLDGDRWVLTGALALGLFVALLVAGAFGPSSFRGTIRSTNQVGIAFQAFIASLVTGVTLVVTIGQLVLSQETGSLEDQRERMEGAMEFRRDVAGSFGSVGSPAPADFLGELVRESRDRADALADAVAECDEEVRSRTERFVDDIVENAEEVDEQLEDTGFGQFALLRAAMNYNYSWKIYGAQWLQAEYDERLGESGRDALADLIDVLKLFGPTRAHFTALYFQWELVRLIRAILLTAIPALTVSIATLLYVEPDSFPGATLGVENVIWAVSAASVLAVVPFLLLASIVLRIATIAKRTSAVGPFVLHESDRSDEVDLDA